MHKSILLLDLNEWKNIGNGVLARSVSQYKMLLRTKKLKSDFFCVANIPPSH